MRRRWCSRRRAAREAVAAAVRCGRPRLLGLIRDGGPRVLGLIWGGSLRALGLIRGGRDAEVALDRGQPPVDGRQQLADVAERYAPDPRASRPGPHLEGSRIGHGAGQLDHLVLDSAPRRAEAGHDLGAHIVRLGEQAEQQVLGADVVVAQVQRLPQR